MKKIACMILSALIILSACSFEPRSGKSDLIIYKDEKMKISYQGIVESKQPWMTERGMEEILVQGVNLKITNYTENSFFVGGSTLIVDGVDASPVSATLKIWAEGTDEYIYYAENLRNLDPAHIKMCLYVFDIHEPRIFEPYEIQLDFSVEY